MISPEEWRQIMNIFFTVRRPVREVFSGEYRSCFKGEGIEFDEVREYIPGDDIRSIDWKVTARYSRPFIKKFLEERELNLMILLDSSASLDFGSVKSKKIAAAELTAALAWAAIINNDRAGMLLYSDRPEKYIRPRKGRHQILRMIRDVINHPVSSGGTDIAGAMAYLHRMMKKRTILFIISDFYSDDFELPLKILSSRHDLVPVVITDPWEENLDAAESFNFKDPETGEEFFLSGGQAEAANRIAGFENEKRDKVFSRCSLEPLYISTDRPFIGDLVKYFRKKFRLR